ncbi:MAG TPA: TonB-dependent receptor [Caulobacteraceae bacterium]|nr:TonB-dependent receptor [Caulobacteraceae bacterium]
MKPHPIMYQLLLGVSAAAISSAALAQTASPPASSDQVVVTGSRLIRNGNASPAPTTVVSVGELTALQPGPVVEALSYLPVMAGSKGLTGNPGTGVSNSAADVMNLRNLGFAETLVLFDGKRIAPTTFDQLVDTDTIPQILLQHVDVVTGGVSAVYGSDAVAGVVNFVTDKNFNGLKIDLEGGVSNYGDEKKDSIGIAAGRSFNDGKGHVELGYEYNNDPGVSRRSYRPWGQDVWAMEGSGTAASPYQLFQNVRFTGYTFGGLITKVTGAAPPGVAAGQMFAQNGVLSPFVNGSAIMGSTSYQSGGSGGYYDASIKDALITNKGFARLDYNFSDSLHAFVEASDSVNHTLNYGAYNQFNNYTFSGGNAFLPAAYQFGGTFSLAEMLSAMPRIDTNTRQNQAFVLAGLDGTFLNDFHWDISYSHSQSASTTRNDNNINTQNFVAALDAVNSGGQTVCRASLTNSAYSNCVPLNVFGPTAPSAAALAYITHPTQFTVNNKLDSVSGSVSGAPFKDWAGPVQIALSGEYRNQSLGVSSTALPSDLANCTSLTYNCTANKTTLWLDATVANLSPVSEHVAEGAVEVDMPLIKDMPFAKDISFNGAARYTDYSVSGSATTWKAGLVWQVNDEFKMRATRSRDIRAPNLYELYQPQSTSNVARFDNLINQSVPAPTYSSGNPNLKPEVAATTTAGFVYQPKWLRNFSFSADAYYIDLTSAIVSESGYFTQNQNVCYASGGTSSFCSLIIRPGGPLNASAAATGWLSTVINANDVKTYGVDFESAYQTRVFDNPLSLRALMTWQPHHVTESPGVPTTEDAGEAFFAYALPVLRLNVNADYKVGNWDLGVLERWRSTMSLENVASSVYVGQTNVPSTLYTDINIQYRMKTWSVGNADLFLNVRNLFNVQPPPAAAATNPSSVGTFGGFVSGDDPIGRYFTLGIRFRH